MKSNIGKIIFRGYKKFRLYRYFFKLHIFFLPEVNTRHRLFFDGKKIKKRQIISSFYN